MSKWFQDIQNFTRDQIAPKVIDTILWSNVILQLLLQKKSYFSSSTKKIPVRYKKTTWWGSFSWLDKFDRNYVEDTVNMSFEPKYYQKSVVIPWIDLSLSWLPETVIELMAYKSQATAQDMADSIWTMLYSDWTWNWWKDFQWLKSAIKTSWTYGWLDLSTYTTLQWNVNTTSYTSWWTKFSLTALDAAIQTVRSWNIKPDLILTSEAVYSIIEALMWTVIQNVTVQNAPNAIFKWKIAALAANTWYEAIYYKWIPIIADEKCPATELYLLNTSTWEFATFRNMARAHPIMLSSSTIEWQYDQNLEKPVWFFMSDWKEAQEQYWIFADYFLPWELICTNPKYNYRFTDIQW